MVVWGYASTRITAFVCLIILACYCSRFVNEQTLTWFFIQLQNDPLGGLWLFLVLSILAVPLLLPGMLVAVGTGAVYGVWAGFIINWFSTSVGQSLAFLLGRYLLRDFVADWLVTKVRNFAAIEKAIAKEGWKLVALLRLSPLLPYNILNYILAITSIDFGAYAIASAVSIIPYTLGFVYLGSLSGDLTAAFSKGLYAPEVLQLKSLWIVGSVIMIVVTGTFLTIISKRTLSAALSVDDSDEDEDSDYEEQTELIERIRVVSVGPSGIASEAPSTPKVL